MAKPKTNLEIDEAAIKKTQALVRAVKRAAKKEELSASDEEILDLASRGISGSSSVDAVAKEVLADLREKRQRRFAREPKLGEANFINTSAVASLLIAVHFKHFVRSFRAAIWESAEHPFETEKDAAMWLEFIRRQEWKREGENVQPLEDEKGKTCALSFHVPEEDRRFLIFIPSGGILERLYLFCEALARVSEWWDTDDVLRHVLFGVFPKAVQVSASGMGNYTESITIKINGPATEEEIVRAYCAGCKVTHTVENRKGLGPAQFRVLYLVEYLMPEATWPERFKQWLEWCKEDERLPNYNASLREDGSVDNPGAWRNLKHEYNRAMDKQSWTGKVPRLFASDEDFQKWTKKVLSRASWPTPSPPAPWDEPDLDTSRFEYPVVDLSTLEELEQKARTMRLKPPKTFVQFRPPLPD